MRHAIEGVAGLQRRLFSGGAKTNGKRRLQLASLGKGNRTALNPGYRNQPRPDRCCRQKPRHAADLRAGFRLSGFSVGDIASRAWWE